MSESIVESYTNWERYLPENNPYTYAVSTLFSKESPVGNNIVQCFPSWKGGAYIIQWASPVELEFLGYFRDDSYHSSPFRSRFIDRAKVNNGRPRNNIDEDDFCLLMIRLGAVFLPWYDHQTAGLMRRSTRYMEATSDLSMTPRRIMVGWPTSPDGFGTELQAWVLELEPLVSVGMGWSAIPIDERFWRIQNATTMEERCREIERLGGKLVDDIYWY